MAGRPILFSGPMVRALLDGTKTQTRRVLIPPKPFDPFDDIASELASGAIKPRYAVGDRLYVREAWRTAINYDLLSPSKIAEHCREAGYGTPWCPIEFVADNARTYPFEGCWNHISPGKFRQGMHMPRWASRITLKVTAVRVQRLQDITDDDALAEGIDLSNPRHGEIDINGDWWAGAFRTRFETLWDSINDARGFGWTTNPWVAAYTFTVHRGNIDSPGMDTAHGGGAGEAGAARDGGKKNPSGAGEGSKAADGGESS